MKVKEMTRRKAPHEKLTPVPRKKMVEVTVYDCPRCGNEMTKPTDPDHSATIALFCPHCKFCY